MMRPSLGVLVCLLLATGCSPSLQGSSVRHGEEAYALIPPISADSAALDYVIGPLDTININVFNEPEISSQSIPVDASGSMALPLIGRVRASGLTATALADSLRERYGRYYVDPQVTVIVTSSVSQRVTVQGEVEDPGIYDVRGGTTLLDAVAMAKGETENAALREVVILRQINGQRMAAMFDVNRIRRGDDPDPAVLGRDVIIVGLSNTKQAWHDALRAAPLFNIFTTF
jgi:polysaccharide export outer membrane protein